MVTVVTLPTSMEHLSSLFRGTRMEKNDHMGYQSQSMPGDEALGLTLHG